MDIGNLQLLPAGQLAAALDSLALDDGWSLATEVREAAAHAPDEPCLPVPNRASPSMPFQNLVVGTLTEHLFLDGYLSPMEAEGFVVVDYHEKGENRDFGLFKDGVELPINVKVASTMFRNAAGVVGLEPEDCIPISVYKALGASEKVPELIYVDLVDFDLRERVDGLIDSLDGDLEIGWTLLSWYGGKGIKAAQDRYVLTLFDRREDQLRALANEITNFRVISAQRVLAIMRENPRRVPGLGVKGVGIRWSGEVNVHVSVRDETKSWEEVAERCRREGIRALLDDVMRAKEAVIPAPLI